MQRLYRKWKLVLTVLPVVALTMILKVIFIVYGWQVLTLNPFMSGVIAANVFLLGFLISAVLVDYKESERLPGELAASVASIFDEVSLLRQGRPGDVVNRALEQILILTQALQSWFYKRERTNDLLDKLSGLNVYLAELEPLAGAASIARIKDQQSAIRRILIRVRTIRGTFFVPSGYAIAELTNIIVIVGLLITRIAEFFESLFFVALITFLVTYMLALIKQLDNPFDYYSNQSGVDEVSLMPLDEIEQRIREFATAQTRSPAPEEPMPHPGVSSMVSEAGVTS